MADKKTSDLPLDPENSAEEELWNLLGQVVREEPSSTMRQKFYGNLEQASRPTLLARLRDVLGFSGNAGWVTAALCLLIGAATGQMLDESSNGNDERLASLAQDVTELNRRLILDRLDNHAPGKRLRGVIDAAYVAGSDEEIARALLARATGDRVHSVRSAAIQALGSQVNSPAVGEQLMSSLRQADSPLVQMALIDLVLRYGSPEQIEQLLALAEDGQLHPDLQRHVYKSLQKEVA